jgi:hypothetical protein
MTEIFVFGSNLAGRHGAGSAREAVQFHGAIYGRGVGPQGLSYAIPTKDKHLRTLSLETISRYAVEFLDYAACHPNDTFHVVAIGCGLAGYKPEQIAPMFVGAPRNVRLPPEFTRANEEQS